MYKRRGSWEGLLRFQDLTQLICGFPNPLSGISYPLQYSHYLCPKPSNLEPKRDELGWGIFCNILTHVNINSRLKIMHHENCVQWSAVSTHTAFMIYNYYNSYLRLIILYRLNDNISMHRTFFILAMWYSKLI